MRYEEEIGIKLKFTMESEYLLFKPGLALLICEALHNLLILKANFNHPRTVSYDV